MAVINNLESYSTTDSLSANMGRELNEYIISVEEYVTSVDDTVSDIDTRVKALEDSSSSGGSQCNCETKIWTTAIE